MYTASPCVLAVMKPASELIDSLHTQEPACAIEGARNVLTDHDGMPPMIQLYNGVGIMNTAHRCREHRVRKGHVSGGMITTQRCPTSLTHTESAMSTTMNIRSIQAVWVYADGQVFPDETTPVTCM